MVPVLDLRNYSQFVIEYLTRLLGRHAAGPALSVTEYLSAFDAIVSPGVPLSNQVTDALYRQARVLRVSLHLYSEKLCSCSSYTIFNIAIGILCACCQKIAINATPDAKLNLFFKPLMERLSEADTDTHKQEVCMFLRTTFSINYINFCCQSCSNPSYCSTLSCRF